MSGLAVTVIEQGLDEAITKLTALTTPDRFELMDTIGRTVQLQTRRRIASEKASPEGAPWPPNRNGTPTLYGEGHLHDSIDYRNSLDEVEVGSPLIYAAIHHFGGVIKAKNAKSLAFNSGNKKVFAKSVTIPARPYLGLSADNQRELESVVADFLGEPIQ